MGLTSSIQIQTMLSNLRRSSIYTFGGDKDINEAFQILTSDSGVFQMNTRPNDQEAEISRLTIENDIFRIQRDLKSPNKYANCHRLREISHHFEIIKRKGIHPHQEQIFTESINVIRDNLNCEEI